MIGLRRRIHANPELGLQEIATSELVAECLSQWGYQVTRAVGKTGAVGTLKIGDGPSLGLRADMDALPIHETIQGAFQKITGDATGSALDQAYVHGAQDLSSSSSQLVVRAAIRHTF